MGWLMVRGNSTAATYVMEMENHALGAMVFCSAGKQRTSVESAVGMTPVLTVIAFHMALTNSTGVGSAVVRISVSDVMVYRSAVSSTIPAMSVGATGLHVLDAMEFLEAKSTGTLVGCVVVTMLRVARPLSLDSSVAVAKNTASKPKWTDFSRLPPRNRYARGKVADRKNPLNNSPCATIMGGAILTCEDVPVTVGGQALTVRKNKPSVTEAVLKHAAAEARVMTAPGCACVNLDGQGFLVTFLFVGEMERSILEVKRVYAMLGTQGNSASNVDNPTLIIPTLNS